MAIPGQNILAILAKAEVQSWPLARATVRAQLMINHGHRTARRSIGSDPLQLVAQMAPVECGFVLWAAGPTTAVRQRRASVVCLATSGGRGVVITGGTKGIGFSLANKFCELGHRVVICGRDQDRLNRAIDVLQGEVYGCRCDVSDAESVANLAQFALDNLGRVDIWINNAGTNSYVRGDLKTLDPAKLKETVETNMLGSLICSRQAIITMEAQDPPGGQLFNMEGAGSFGDATSGYAAYGATKSSVPQLTKTLVAETKGSPVGCNILSPGMVLTDLLLADSTPTFRRFFNLIAEEPDTVAENVVPRILETRGTNKAVRFLSVPGALVKIVAKALTQRNKFFDDKGDRIPVEGTEYDERGVRKLP